MGKKLYHLKNWYSLEDAAKRLTLTLGEDVGLQDIIQLMVDGEIGTSWYLQHTYIRKISFCCYVPQLWIKQPKIEPTIEEVAFFLERKFGDKTQGYSLGVYPQSPVITFDGILKVDLEENGAIKDWLLSHITGKDSELIQMTGFFLTDSKANIWQVMDTFGAELEKQFPQGCKENGGYYPSETLPELSQLVISKADLEEFEAKFEKEEQDNKPLHKKERDSMLKMISGLLSQKYGYDSIKGGKVTAQRISDNILTSSGIKINDDTVRKYVREAIELTEDSN